jgi:fructokinase
MRIGVDLGGTKTESIAIDDAGIERARLRVPTPSGSYDAIVACIVGLVRDTEALIGQTGSVGIGIPGALSPATGLVKNANTVALIGHPLDRDLARALARPVRVANDANCFALSEASDGAGAGARVVFGVIVGTGTGGGVVVEGKLLTGPHAIAGEWGHNPLPWPRDDERPGPALLLRKERLHRDLPGWPQPGPRPSAARRRNPRRQRHRPACGSRRRGRLGQHDSL